jgi:hypothetical protein
MNSAVSRQDAADQFREQAASCWRPAGRARTEKGPWALNTIAKQFHRDARLIDPTSERR